MQSTELRIKPITGIAAKFRAAILKTPQNERPIGFRDFPHGSCGDTTLLLGTMLSELGWGDFTYIDADRGSLVKGNYRTHGWIEQNGLIVDVTADQFPEINEPVIVTEHSRWHQTFKRRKSHKAHIDAFEGSAIITLRRYYEGLRKTILQ